MVSLQEMQVARAQRAEETPFSFRLTEIAGRPVVYVVNPETANIWTVTSESCNCPDHQRRCAGTTLLCKHRVAAAGFLRNAVPVRPEPTAEQIERARAQRDLWR